ncbi:MFS transporter [Pseudomonas silensiensis]|uniref:MFS transporter n=1 Tax=Pseudomonas silensiensis TaxID=2991049 RepID=UPI003D257A3D
MNNSSLSTVRMLLFAFAAGAMIANMYYLQPILSLVAGTFAIPVSTSGLIVSCTQLGYTLGILMVVPLGDVLARRGLLTVMFAVNACALLVAALSPNFVVFSLAALISGTTSSSAMLIVPYVASIAPIEQRGRMVGVVMTGALLAIPLSWLVSGGIGNFAGWRMVYGVACVAVILLLFLLRRSLPQEPERKGRDIHYGDLMKSLVQISARHAPLRRRALYGALGMASFSSLWTGLPILLSQPPYSFPASTIGLIGITGIAGALVPGLIGRLSDQGYKDHLTIGLALLMLTGWISLSFSMLGLWVIISSAIALNIAVMGLQITHQSVIYKLEPNANSRITAVFVAVNFIGAAIGSALASIWLRHFGWKGLCFLGAGFPAFLLITYCFMERAGRQQAT